MSAAAGQPFSQPGSYPPPISIGGQRKPSPQRDTHRRSYHACTACQDRKVKCDLGSVDNPHDPPCARCSRERKACVFAQTRRKHRNSGSEAGGNSDAEQTPHGRQRKRRMTGSANPDNGQLPQPLLFSHQPQYEQRQSHLPYPHPPQYPPATGEFSSNDHLVNNEAAILNSEFPTSMDAMNLLNLGNQTVNFQQNAGQHSAHLKSPGTNYGTPITSSFQHQRNMSNNFSATGHSSANVEGGAASETRDFVKEAEYRQALEMWSRMRLVKDGWFTAGEAIAYVDYYYDHLAPMTPVVIHNYRPHRMHSSLVADEPILALTLMTMASRHMKLQGLGATSRAPQIHGVLWNNLRGMIQRLVWGQEQFGGGFSSGGVVKTHESKTGHISWKGSLRTLGTIEALLLLTDWHPRALHFPPGDNEARLLDEDLPAANTDATSQPEENPVAFSSWLEPAWRSDRMSWTLLGVAVALSFEAGVFDNMHYICRDFHGPGSECARKQRVRRMVLVYMSQTSGRLGLQPTLSFEDWQTDKVYEQTSQAHRVGSADPVDLMQECWLGIAGLMYKANKEIFPAKQYTRNLTRDGDYVQKIEQFKPMLRAWRANFDQNKQHFEPVMQHLLSMEYDYARLFINSLGFQKVVESWVKMSSNTGSSEPDAEKTAGSNRDLYTLLLNIWRPNKEYINEVSGAAHNMLRTVRDGLVPGGHLVHATLRSYFRILPALLFVLKRFTLGAQEHEVRDSLALLDSVTEQLEKCVVDDVHLSTRMADGVRGLSFHLRKMFIRIQAHNGGTPGDLSRGNSRPETPQTGPTSHMPASQHLYDQSQAQSAGPNMDANAFAFDPRLNHQFPDPLADIQRQTMADVADMSFMPPTNYGEYMEQHPGSFDSNAHGQDVNGIGATTDWFALPIGRIMAQDSGVPVHQGIGGIGPAVGDHDMLELISDEPYRSWAANNMHNPAATLMPGPATVPHRMQYQAVNGNANMPGNMPGSRPGYHPPHV